MNENLDASVMPEDSANKCSFPDSPLHLRHSAFLASAAAHQSSDPHVESREPVQLMVIGSAQGIETIVQTLHLRGFAHVSEWSIAMPHSSGRLMRVLTRWVQQGR
ncbi:MAG: hypothetical protein WA939_11065 [Nodosilinea sp.]